jgi:hypothetical protein
MNKYEVIEEYKKYTDIMGKNCKKDFVKDYVLHLYNIGKISIADFEETQKELLNILKGYKE